MARAISIFLSVYWGRWEDAERDFNKAVLDNPNNAEAWFYWADAMAYDDSAADGLKCISSALRLNPRPPLYYYWIQGQAYYAAHNYVQAIEAIDKIPTASDGRRFRAAALAQLGRIGEAHEEAESYLRHHPEFTIRRWVSQRPFRHGPTRDHFVEGFRKAGLPE